MHMILCKNLPPHTSTYYLYPILPRHHQTIPQKSLWQLVLPALHLLPCPRIRHRVHVAHVRVRDPRRAHANEEGVGHGGARCVCVEASCKREQLGEEQEQGEGESWTCHRDDDVGTVTLLPSGDAQQTDISSTAVRNLLAECPREALFARLQDLVLSPALLPLIVGLGTCVPKGAACG
jgi:hypothetical protein